MNKLNIGLLLLLICSCKDYALKGSKTNESESTLSKMKQMEWIIGKWENKVKYGILYEIWTKTNDSIYSGKSFIIANNDTVFSETISLKLKNNELFYIPNVSDQNNAQPITFKYISNDNSEITFENKEHDFPQRIIYKNLTSDSLYSRIEGNENGDFRKEEFFMKRSRQK